MNCLLMNLNVQKNVTVLSEPRKDTQKLAGPSVVYSPEAAVDLNFTVKTAGFTIY